MRCRSVMGPDAPVRSTVVAADWPLLAAAYRTRAALRIVNDLLADDDARRTWPARRDWRVPESIARSTPGRRREFWPIGTFRRRWDDGILAHRRFWIRQRDSSSSAWIR